MFKFTRPLINTAIIVSLVGILTLAISTSAASPASAETYNTRCTSRVLDEGDNGNCVRQAQRKLSEHGAYGGTIDGIFGAQTKAAVIQAQQRAGIEDDGIIGPDTWRALNQPVAQANATIDDIENFDNDRRSTKQRVDGLLPSKCRTADKTICVIKGQGSEALLVAVRNNEVQRYMIVRTGDARGADSATTIGNYKVTWKDIDHVSSKYNKAPMDYSLFFNQGQAIHYSQDFADHGYGGANGASHGCVNVKSRADARWLYNWSAEGSTNVIVTRL